MTFPADAETVRSAAKPQEWYDPPEGRASKLAGRLQGWLHGRNAWTLIWLGNLISDLRYRSWVKNGGSHG